MDKYSDFSNVQIDEEFEHEDVTLVCREIKQKMLDDFYKDTLKGDICKKCYFHKLKGDCSVACVKDERPDRQNVYFPIK